MKTICFEDVIIKYNELLETIQLYRRQEPTVYNYRRTETLLGCEDSDGILFDNLCAQLEIPPDVLRRALKQAEQREMEKKQVKIFSQ